MKRIKIKEIYCGQKQTIVDGKKEPYISSYKKEALYNDLYTITSYGFELDTQSDTKHHGGIDKAICVYAQKNYDFFKEKYKLELSTCTFGENFTIEEVDDSQICLGDQFKHGEVIYEVSQPRQPCWKISSITGIKNLTSLVVTEFKTGFYLRVIKEGLIKSKDELVLIERKFPKLTIEYINKCAFDAKNNQENIKEILECRVLAQAYRKSLFKRYNNKESGLQLWQFEH